MVTEIYEELRMEISYFFEGSICLIVIIFYII